MKSITVHNIDDKTVALLEGEARATGQSLNKTIKMLLRKSLGLSQTDPEKGFDEFVGVWSEEDYSSFEEAVKELNHVDEEDWI